MAYSNYVYKSVPENCLDISKGIYRVKTLADWKETIIMMMANKVFFRTHHSLSKGHVTVSV